MSIALVDGAMAPRATKPIDPESFFWFLKTLAAEQRMTLSAVLKKAGLTPQGAERWKIPPSSPRMETRVMLARAMSLPTSRLIRPGEQVGDAPTATEAERDDRYPSLVAFLQTHPTLEDERNHLETQRFLFGDPDSQEVWLDYLHAYRKAKQAKSAPAQPSASAAKPLQKDRQPLRKAK
jgi:transcriptional regulator with XRE-family HTH domain